MARKKSAPVAGSCYGRFLYDHPSCDGCLAKKICEEKTPKSRRRRRKPKKKKETKKEE